ncbi:hypothetical protein HHK36_009130 [Tetracentron sinense]|uniref:Uncharacterized protein n=1 Tax=Tetracentron sinense TaxID=13715 RepID=A0A835DI24_TETSI|nr:hypothetical protein HHK36_009130 [Tetracentron sinense]
MLTGGPNPDPDSIKINVDRAALLNLQAAGAAVVLNQLDGLFGKFERRVDDPDHTVKEICEIEVFHVMERTDCAYAMANSKWSSNLRNLPYAGKQSQLPPKSPFPSISPSYADYGSSPAVGSKGIPKPREGHRHHQRTSSESFLVDEQPSWLEELLDEPETPVRRGGHRRSSSDSFAYLDAANASNIDYVAQDEFKLKNITGPIWGSQDFDHYKDAMHATFNTEPDSFRKLKNRAWESSLNSVTYPSGLLSARDITFLQSSGSSCAPQEPDRVLSAATGKQDQNEFGSHDLLDGSYERRDDFYAKPSAVETDPKHSKQQFAQRSRVRKLHYIADLERNVEALQAKGFEVSAELGFQDKQNLILSMENKALKQRLDSLAQEQLIKHFRVKTFCLMHLTTLVAKGLVSMKWDQAVPNVI